jgi:peptide-methionine (R)-S-oxide reductase
MSYAIQKTAEEWQALLAAKHAEPGAYQVTRHAATERPFTGRYADHWQPGFYSCICCGARLFESDTKFDAGCGWPSYSQAIEDDRIAEHRDTSHGMVRTEIVCKACGAHLGHVFPDGPAPTGMRHCVNAASLTFEPKQE